MKTIALSDTAYDRLLSWKSSRKESFSQVVERLIPPKGTLDAAFESARQNLPDLPGKELDAIESVVASNRQPLNPPWN
jgi:predicted CopG family antitoxin